MTAPTSRFATASAERTAPERSDFLVARQQQRDRDSTFESVDNRGSSGNKAGLHIRCPSAEEQFAVDLCGIRIELPVGDSAHRHRVHVAGEQESGCRGCSFVGDQGPGMIAGQV